MLSGGALVLMDADGKTLAKVQLNRPAGFADGKTLVLAVPDDGAHARSGRHDRCRASRRPRRRGRVSDLTVSGPERTGAVKMDNLRLEKRDVVTVAAELRFHFD